jgi:hypothetical protein
MTLNQIALLIGLFVIPLTVLWLGHKLRRRPPRQRGAFWGSLVGYLVSGLVAVIMAVCPPEMWAPGDTMRAALGLWSMVVLPIVGGAIGAARAT